MSRSLLLVCLQYKIIPINKWTGFPICSSGTNDTNRWIDLARPSGVKIRCSLPWLHCAFVGVTCAANGL